MVPPLVMWTRDLESVWQVVDGSLNPGKAMLFRYFKVKLDWLTIARRFFDSDLFGNPVGCLMGHVIVSDLT